MKIKEIITELFNSKSKIENVKATSDMYDVSAIIGNRRINFLAVKDDADEWDIQFYETPIKQARNNYDNFEKTGSGNEFNVFSFVIECLKKFLADYKPGVVYFTSEKSDANRTGLYAKMLARYKVPGYSVRKEQEGGADVFALVRDK